MIQIFMILIIIIIIITSHRDTKTNTNNFIPVQQHSRRREEYHYRNITHTNVKLLFWSRPQEPVLWNTKSVTYSLYTRSPFNVSSFERSECYVGPCFILFTINVAVFGYHRIVSLRCIVFCCTSILCVVEQKTTILLYIHFLFIQNVVKVVYTYIKIIKLYIY